MKVLWNKIRTGWGAYKPWVNAIILITILVFLGVTFERHWQEVSALHLTTKSWACLAFATGITLLAYIWTGWIWGLILAELGQPVSKVWAIQACLKTNIAKYLPSNLLHLYGRTLAAIAIGVPAGTAALSVLLDSMLTAAGGWVWGLLSIPHRGILASALGLVAMLGVIHPRVLRFLMQKLMQSMRRVMHSDNQSMPDIKRYPVWPLVGEIFYVFLRGVGFVTTLLALTSFPIQLVPRLISVFSVGWLLGFIAPGVPAGIGIFEVTLITLLSHTPVLQAEQELSVGVILGAVAIYRLVCILAEAMGAALAWLDERLTTPYNPMSIAARQLSNSK